MEKYGKKYFELGEGSGYINYSWIPQIIGPRAEAILSESKITAPAKILDFGCAKGYYVRWLREKGFKAIGVDTSLYALSQSPQNIRNSLFLSSQTDLLSFDRKEFDLVILKDVLEHLTQENLREIFKKLKIISKKIFITVPICNQYRNYINEIDEKDITHKIRYTKNEWKKFLGAGENYNNLNNKIKGIKSKGTFCTILTNS